jgi:hypothetical protein
MPTQKGTTTLFPLMINNKQHDWYAVGMQADSREPPHHARTGMKESVE